jgi:hypothetical protein
MVERSERGDINISTRNIYIRRWKRGKLLDITGGEFLRELSS